MRASETAAASAGGSFPFLAILCLIFITLKLTGVITWSWLWVLAPLWMPVCVILGVVLIFGGIYLGIKAITAAFSK